MILADAPPSAKAKTFATALAAALLCQPYFRTPFPPQAAPAPVAQPQ